MCIYIHLINAMQWTFNSLFRLERDTASSKAWFRSLTKMSWQSPRGALSMGNHDGHDMNTSCLQCILKTPSTFFNREVMRGIDWVFLHSIGQWLRIIFVGTFSPILGEDFAFHVSFSVANRQIENDQTALKLVWGVTSVLVWPQAAYLHFGVWGLASWKSEFSGGLFTRWTAMLYKIYPGKTKDLLKRSSIILFNLFFLRWSLGKVKRVWSLGEYTQLAAQIITWPVTTLTCWQTNGHEKCFAPLADSSRLEDQIARMDYNKWFF